MIVGSIVGTRFFGPADNTTWAVLLVGNLMPMAAIGVFSGFGSTMIDPARPQHAGFWFWLRVPVVAFFVVGLIMTMPGLMVLGMDWTQLEMQGHLGSTALVALSVGAGCGLVAFFRFGGFNGAQHFFLRWQLARSGDLPPKAESFFNHAAQLALMQKVGLGYRFVHALLLEHLAVTKGGAAARGAALSAAEQAPPGVSPAGQQPDLGRARNAGRIMALAGLAVGLVLLVVLAVVGLSLCRNWQSQQSMADTVLLFGACCLGLWLAIPALYLGAAWLWRCSWRVLVGGYLALGLVLGWLAVDDPAIRRPAGLGEIAPVFPGAEKSHAVLMRYGPRRPATKSFQRPGFNFFESPAYPKNWPAFLRQHRAEIEANWAALTPVREWMAELNAFDRIGDLGDDLGIMETVTHPVQFAYTQNVMAIASLQALDGQGDDALATLRPLLEVGGKLEVSAHGMLRLALGRDLQEDAIRTAGFVLDTTPVSVAARKQFAEALARWSGGPAGARRLYALRHAAVFESTASFGHAVAFATQNPYGVMQMPLDLVGPFLLNRRATLNRVGDLYAELAEFAARRETDQADKRLAEFLAEEGRVRFKNMGGAWFHSMVGRQLTMSFYENRRAGYWAMEDRRDALHARLLQP